MAPYEYRVCALPDQVHEFAWDITIYMRKISDDPAETAWRVVHRTHANGAFNGDRPAAYWKDIVKACKV